MSDEKNTTQQETEPAAMPLKLDISTRPIEPKGNLVGFASVKFNDAFVVEDFKILQSDKGLFVGMPSKPDKSSKTCRKKSFHDFLGSNHNIEQTYYCKT